MTYDIIFNSKELDRRRLQSLHIQMENDQIHTLIKTDMMYLYNFKRFTIYRPII